MKQDDYRNMCDEIKLSEEQKDKIWVAARAKVQTKKENRQKMGRFAKIAMAAAAIIVFFMVTVLFPFAWILLTSLKEKKEMFSAEFHFLPLEPTLNSYRELFEKTDFIHNMWNSLVVSFVTVLIAGIVSFMAGYALSRYRFKIRNGLMYFFLLLYLVPSTLLLIPLYTIFNKMGILHTQLCLIIAYSTYSIPYSVWLTTGFINQVPYELEEAAALDGCNLFQRMIRIVLPLLRPAMVASLSFIFITSWNEYTYANMFTNKDSRTVTVALSNFMSQYNIRWDLITAGGIIVVIPVVIMFVIVQKDLIAGLTAGGVKG